MKRHFIVLACAVTAFGFAGYAVGAEGNGPASGDTLQEVVVTAQKREERLKDVPISIVAVGAEELKVRQINSLEDLPYAVPNLAISNAGNSHYIEIRGISNIVGSSSLIGIYLDDTDMTLGGTSVVQANPVTYDLERVEVLRGPQGTLYGEGSAGGTIRFITKKPKLDRFGFDATVAALFTEHGNPSQRINAVANVPLIENQLAIRVAGTFQHDGGWIDQPAAGTEDINSEDLTNVRIKGLWQPSEQLSLSGMVIVNRDERGMDFSDLDEPYEFTQTFGLTTAPKVKNNYDLYSLTAAYDFSGARLSNTVGYIKMRAPQRGVPAFFPITADPGPGEVFDYFVELQDITERLLTDELRLTSTGTGPWQWTVGGFFRRHKDSVAAPKNYFDFPGLPGVLPEPYGYALSILHRSWSAFADVSYRLDRLTIGAGVRSFRERQNFDDISGGTEQVGHYHSVDPRVYAQLKMTDAVNLYASVAKGFRSGGFNQFNQPRYQPEDVWTYELGSKMSFGEGRVELDADVFWTNYSDYQTFAPLPGAELFSAIQNVGRARIKGVEADASWRPAEPWRLEARGSYLDARFTKINESSTAYLAGDPIDLVPRYQFTVSAQLDFRWLQRDVVSRLDYSEQGPQVYRNRSSGDFYHNLSDTIERLDFNTSVYWSDSLTWRFFARNLLDDKGFTNPYSLIGNGVRSRPRTFGVEFSAEF